MGSCSSILNFLCIFLTTIVFRFVPFLLGNCNVCPSIYGYHFQSQESERVMYFYAKGIDIASFTILIFDFGTVPTLSHCGIFFKFYYFFCIFQHTVL